MFKEVEAKLHDPEFLLKELLDEIVEARIWAGLHFRTADVQGRDLGINVANFMADNYFEPVGKANP